MKVCAKLKEKYFLIRYFSYTQTVTSNVEFEKCRKQINPKIMNEDKNQLDQLYNQIEKAKKEFAKIIISGLSDNDPKEVTFTCELIKKELIPALELDKAESKENSLNTLNSLIFERRPPKNNTELLDLENAAFFKIVNDTQKGVIEEEKIKPKEEYLKTRSISIEQLEKQYKGRQFGELVLHHVKTQTPKQINDAIIGLRGKIYPALAITTDKFLETVVFGFSTTKELWKHDCGETLKIYTTATKVEAEKYKIKVTDDYAFDVFNLIVLSLAQRAVNEPDFKNFIKKSIKKFWIF